MVDLKGKTFKLKKNKVPKYEEIISPLMIDDEIVISEYMNVSDIVVFTNKRIIAVEGATKLIGKKKEFSTLPYSKIQAFSVETSGRFDLDSELELVFSGLGTVEFEFSGDNNILEIANIIGNYIL